MASLTIHGIDDALKHRLRLRAASRNRSMQEELRQILRSALLAPAPRPGNLATRLRARFEALGGVELPLPAREALRPAPAFDPDPELPFDDLFDNDDLPWVSITQPPAGGAG